MGFLRNFSGLNNNEIIKKENLIDKKIIEKYSSTDFIIENMNENTLHSRHLLVITDHVDSAIEMIVQEL